MDKSVLELEEILGPRDEQLLHNLATYEPAILDDVTNYHLGSVGCVTTDTPATRLLSAAIQVVFEKAIDEAKLIHASCKGSFSGGLGRTDVGSAALHRTGMRRSGRPEEASAPSTGTASGTGEVKELDLDSLCKALQRNGTLPVGPSLDLLLQPVGPTGDSAGP